MSEDELDRIVERIANRIRSCPSERFCHVSRHLRGVALVSC